MDISSDEDEPAVNVPPEAEIKSEVPAAKMTKGSLIQFQLMVSNGFNWMTLMKLKMLSNGLPMMSDQQ